MIEIKDISGQVRFSTPINKGAKGKFTLMKEDYIILPFSVPSPIPFKLGDYVDLAGVLDESLGGKLAKIYEITDLQKPTYNSSTGGYDYELQMNAYYWKWKNKIFKYTPEQAGSEASWSLTAALDVQLGVFLRNLKALGYTYRGTDFTFSIDDTVENKAVAMTYDNMNLLDALFSMAGEDKWNCDCWITDNVIHFGRNEFGDAVKIERGVEASSITRSESQGTYATRIYAFGSTKNIPTNYRPTDEQVVINGVVQKRLMLPADTPYIDAYEGMSQEEAIEDVVVFDDVYPRRVGTLSDVHTRTEEVENEDGTKETVTYYRYKDTGLEFKEEYIIEGQELKIRFQSGKLNGMEFGVIFNPTPKDETRGEQLWEIVRNEDYGRPLPDDTICPSDGDEYILSGFDIQLVSDQYIPAAEQELKEKAQKYADKVKKDDGTYPTTLMSTWVHEDPISRTFEFGQRINLVDDTYFENGRISRVLGWEMNLDIPWDSPVYTIGESMPYSRIGEIESDVESLTYKGQTYFGKGGVYLIKVNDSTAPSDSNAFSALRALKMFLRKDQPDETNYLLKLLGGVLVDGLARFGDFVTGVSGGMIDDGELEMESGYFRKRLFVPELAFNRITYFKGRAVLSPGGGCKVKSYVKNDDGSFTVTPDLTDADALSQFKDDILSAYFTTKNEEGALTGFEQMQFRVTEADYSAKTFKMVNKPGQSFEPGEEMILAQTGNFSDEDRQTYILFDTVNGNNCITFFDHANTWDPEPAQMPAWFGKKKGMTVGGINCDNYSAVLQNILLTGLIFQIDEITGDSVRVPIDKGEWKEKTKYGYYDRVSHNGALWLCVSEEATEEEPGTGNAWLKQVAEGQKGDPGLSVVGGGHWESSKTPYEANTLVSFYNCVFISNVKTSNPPIAIARFKDGSYIRQKNGGYILAGRSADFTVHPDWTMLLDGRELKGTSITFLGSFATAPSNPVEGNSYYNTTDKCTYIYQNGIWMLMVSDGKDGRDYEYIYTRNNSIGITPDKPDSKQQDDYVPDGWTDDYLGVSETFQVEWGCKRTKRDGIWSEWSDPAPIHRWAKDGENAVIADLDNEMVNCALTSDGKVSKQQSWTTNVTMWYGYEELELTALTTSQPSGLTVQADKSSGAVTVTATAGASLAETNNVVITLTASKNGQNFERQLTFTVAGVRAGADGTDAVLYSLLPSVSSVAKYKNGSYSATTVSCKRQKTVGGTILDTTDGELKYSRDGGAETNYTDGTAISVTTFTKSIKFLFYVGGKLVDVETIPMLSDGTDGTSIESVGHWEASQVPYAVNKLVNFGRGTFVALQETSEPPLPIARFKDGTYMRKKDGGYILAGRSADMTVNPSWRMMSWSDEAETLYWLDCPISAFSYTSTGSPSPSSVEVTCKMSRGGSVSDCVTLWLAARRYNGSWVAHVGATQSSKIYVPATAGYTQFVVRAYKSSSDASAWNSNYVAERGIGVAQAGKDGTDYEYIFQRTTTNERPSTPATAQQDDYVPSGWTDDPEGVSETYPYEWASMRTKNDGIWGAFCRPYPFGVKGETGATGAGQYDRGIFKTGNSYVWNADRRDKIIYLIGGVYYNFLVKNYGATVTVAPTSASGDSNWEAMQKFENVVTNTFFADGANIAGFMFKLLGYINDEIPYGEIRSQNVDGNDVPVLYMNSKTGYFRSILGEIGAFTIDERGLKNLSESPTAYIQIEKSGGKFFRVNMSDSYMCSIRADSATALHISTYGSSNNSIGIDIIANASGYGYAIRSSGNILMTARAGELIKTIGHAVNSRYVSTSTSLTSADDSIIFSNTSNITVSLPTANAFMGKIYYMKRIGTGTVTLSANNFVSQDKSTENKTTYVISDNKPRIFIFIAGDWYEFYCGN